MADFNPSLIAAVDIGSPMTGKLGWAVLPDEKIGKDVQTLVALVAKALLGGPVALGFEAPLWVPTRMDEMLLTKARQGEGARSWSARAGSGVLTTGLAVIPYILYILSRLRQAAPSAMATLDFRDPPCKPGELFLWEAFVSGHNKGDSHEDDAMIAARAFRTALANLSNRQMLTSEPCLNLLGAFLLRTEWSSDLNLLRADTLV